MTGFNDIERLKMLHEIDKLFEKMCHDCSMMCKTDGYAYTRGYESGLKDTGAYDDGFANGKTIGYSEGYKDATEKIKPFIDKIKTTIHDSAWWNASKAAYVVREQTVDEIINYFSKEWEKSK